MQALLLKSEDTARILSISPRTLWTLTKESAIRSVRIGRNVRYSMCDVEAFIEARRSINQQPSCVTAEAA